MLLFFSFKPHDVYFLSTGLLLPVPDISLLNCISQTEEVTRLKVTCTPPDEAAKVVELVCSVDGEPLKPCSQLSNRRKKRGVNYLIILSDFELCQIIDMLSCEENWLLCLTKELRVVLGFIIIIRYRIFFSTHTLNDSQWI